MFSLNNKISVRQLQALLILDVFGTGIIILPRRAALFADQDGWIAVIISTVLAMCAAYLITTIGRMFPRDSFVVYTGKVLSKPIGIILSFGLVVKIIITVAMELRFFGEIIKQTMLFNTPFPVVCGGMVLVSAYAAAKGYETRGRIGELLILILFIPISLIILIVAADVDYSNLMPIMVTPPEMLIKGGFYSLISFSGLEFCLLIHPYMVKKKCVRKSVVRVVACIGFSMVLITAMALSKFGPLDTKYQMWPVLEMVDAITFPGDFIERQEALIMSFWIISVFAITNASLFFSSLLLKDVINKGRHSTYIIICGLIAFGISFIPKDVFAAYEIMESVFFSFGVAYLFVIPFVLIIVAKIRGKGITYD